MTNIALRIPVIFAALMGAAGVVLAAAAAHQPEATRLGAASSMLLFHAPIVIVVMMLIGHGLVQRCMGIAAGYGFLVGATLFAGDLALRQYGGHGLFPMAAPTGGTLLIIGWIALAIAAAWPRRPA